MPDTEISAWALSNHCSLTAAPDPSDPAARRTIALRLICMPGVTGNSDADAIEPSLASPRPWNTTHPGVEYPPEGDHSIVLAPVASRSHSSAPASNSPLVICTGPLDGTVRFTTSAPGA